jgi:UDP-N-acetylmuramoyl-tripeptide--D-alanyl-D-alanine ligase
MRTIISELYQKFKASSGISTDTRSIEQNSIFFALKGESFNGNKYAITALEKGASFAVIDEAEYALDERFILTDDVLVTLQNLANFHRKQLQIPVVGLTGSNGKTTTKELIAAVLCRKYKTYFTKGNLNNHIGVPLTLLAIDETCEIAVVEMGANHQQEIELLASIAEPTHGLITNVGKAHLEGFGGFEGVKKGKGELYAFLEKSGGTVFVNVKNEILVEMASKYTFKEQVKYLEDERIELRESSPFVRFMVHETKEQKSKENELVESYPTHLTGSYNFENIAAALSIGDYFGVEKNAAVQAICSYNPDNNRSQTIQKGTNTLLLDAYNANPSSMRAAIQNFMDLKADKKMLILGDMRELGEEAQNEHLEIGKLVATAHFDIVVLYGDLMQHALPALPNAYYFSDKFSIHNWLQDKKIENSHILIKGSRGMGLESTIQFL